MIQYMYSDSSESSDSENQSKTFNPNKTLNFSEVILNLQDATKQLENLCKSTEKRKEFINAIVLTHNELDMIPLNIANFTNLKILEISNNLISTLPDAILQLPLTTLIMKNNRLVNSGLPKLFGKLNLKDCRLSGNNFSNFPEQLLEIKSLEYLYLGNNSITELPKEIDALKRLKILNMGGNYLSEIPASVGNLTNLRGLILSDNALETVPSSIANLKNLKSLLLHKNRLRTLPPEIVSLKCLTELSLRENPLVVRFVNDMLHDPPSLLELAGRSIKLYNIDIPDGELPATLREYLKSAHRCVNPKCKGVFFDNRVEHIKFVDFCGKYRIPLLQYLCSSKCVVNNSILHGSHVDTIKMHRVLLG